MATIVEKLITAEEFARMPEPEDGSKQELVRGEIVTMPPPNFKHGLCQMQVGFKLKAFVDPQRLGRVVSESGLITERDPDTVRGPDISYYSAERLPLNVLPEVYPEVPADLCVEVLTPDSRPGEILGKIREYFARGVRMVWVIDPEARTVTVYRHPDEGRVLHEAATLTVDDVLPGFACKVAELFS